MIQNNYLFIDIIIISTFFFSPSLSVFRPYKICPPAKNKERPTELYGEWQTDPWAPMPVTEDGKITKNAQGNIEIFNQGMVPAGAVHVVEEGDVAETARLLGINFAPALVGFKQRNGKTEAILEGVVVALESEEILREAHRMRADHAEEKQAQKRERQVRGYWVTLIKEIVLKGKLAKEFESDRLGVVNAEMNRRMMSQDHSEDEEEKKRVVKGTDDWSPNI